MVAKEPVNTMVLSRKDNAILDGTEMFNGISRMAQLEPLAALKAVVAQRQYLLSRGHNLFQLCAHLPYDGRGQRFYRKDWLEGTMEKYVTLSAVVYDRDGGSGTAYGYITFHGESTVRSVCIEKAEYAGWACDYKEENAVPYDREVTPPPSIGYDVPVDPSVYKLKAYPFYDPPNPPQFVSMLLRDRGIIPDIDPSSSGEGDDDSGNDPNAERGDTGDGSIPYEK